MKKLAFIVVVLVGLLVVGLHLHWQMRVRQQVTWLTVSPEAKLEFRSPDPQAQWIPIAPEDAVGVVRSFNAGRLLLAEQTTPFLPFVQPVVLAIAPMATLRVDGVPQEWYIAPRDDRFMRKYLLLSTGTKKPSPAP